MSSEPVPSIGGAPPPSPSPSTIYRSLHAYQFDQDHEYLAGLASILGHPETTPTTEELTLNPDLILQARCFYFARRHNLPAIDTTGYQQWLSQNTSTAPSTIPTTDTELPASSPSEASTIPVTAASAVPTPSTTESSEQQPPYPTSFAAIVDLITRNVPVPGIEEIPDTVLEHGSSKVDHTPRRRKPWEADGADVLPVLPVVADSAGGPVEVEDDAQVHADDQLAQERSIPPPAEEKVNGHLATGEGVVKILQEGAIPDSGLLAKD